MEIKHLSSNKGNTLEGIYLIKPKIYEDQRGFMRVGIKLHLMML